MRIYHVGELVTYLKELLETDAGLDDIWVGGEMSNVSLSGSGHYYFTLKERNSQVKCVLFRGQALWQTLVPQNGLAVLAHGRISLYEASGQIQLYVDLLQSEGQGKLALEFEQLKARLDAEGLFAPERKRPLPSLPLRIGVVTSPQAAAFQDILNVLGRRYPLATLVLAPTLVQGENAPPQIVSALQALNALNGPQAVDVILVARGGGAPEELAAFNDERVARAVFASRVPVITGVGHETDTTIVDYVSDLRAPTPSAAAELIAPDVADLAQTVEALRRLLWDVMSAQLGDLAGDLAAQQDRLARYSPQAQVAQWRQRVDTLAETGRLHLGHTLSLNRARLATRQAELAALSPAAISARGYAVVRNRRTGAVLRRAADASPGDLLEIHLQDGVVPARVTPPEREAGAADPPRR
jgi:exodeoxyribonuclease VII large subunit